MVNTYFLSDISEAQFGRRIGSKDKQKRKPINIAKQALIGGGIGGGLGVLGGGSAARQMGMGGKAGLGLTALSALEGATKGMAVGAGQAAIRKKIRVDKGKEKWKSGFMPGHRLYKK
jgi:hypothetical protein